MDAHVTAVAMMLYANNTGFYRQYRAAYNREPELNGEETAHAEEKTQMMNQSFWGWFAMLDSRAQRRYINAAMEMYGEEASRRVVDHD